MALTSSRPVKLFALTLVGRRCRTPLIVSTSPGSYTVTGSRAHSTAVVTDLENHVTTAWVDGRPVPMYQARFCWQVSDLWIVGPMSLTNGSRASGKD
jgi:hypothetical protein